MPGDLKSSLQRAATSTFEELGFLFATPEPDEDQATAAVEAVARVAFAGPCRGVLEVRLAGGVLGALTLNMLGTDELPEESVRLDALGELANVICGNLVPEISGPTTVFDLEAPRVVSGVGHALSPIPDPATRLSFGIDAGRADLTLHVNEAREAS